VVDTSLLLRAGNSFVRSWLMQVYLGHGPRCRRGRSGGEPEEEEGRRWERNKVLDIVFNSKLVRRRLRLTPIIIRSPTIKHRKIPGKLLLPTRYGDYRGNDILEEKEVKLGFILSDDFFCFLITRKVSTTCSKNARAGS